MSANITIHTHIDTAKKFIEETVNDDQKKFFFVGNTISWTDEFSPDVSNSSNIQLNDANRKKLYIKQIQDGDISLAIKRFNWVDNTLYTQADHDVDYNDVRTWVDPMGPFYVMNSEENVYKCISNNLGILSTDEPIGTSTGYISTSDGYLWKFMFNLKTVISDKFLTDVWIPLPHNDIDKSVDHLATESAAVEGDIPKIKITNAGSGYTTIPTIQVRGDGTGCTAIATLDGNGGVGDIIVTGVGQDYTYADVLVFGDGEGATALAMVAPAAGHGSESETELGAIFTEVSVSLIGDENAVFPTLNSYRTIGLVRDVKDKTGNIIVPDNVDKSFNTLSDISITSSSGDYLQNEVVIGGDSQAQGILFYEPTGTDKVVMMYMIDGDFIDGETLYGQTSNIFGTYNEAGSTLTTVDINSGVIVYKENIIFITRRDIQTEKFVFTIEF